MEYYNSNGTPRTDLPDGVYFDLPEEVYFVQPRLGSSDLCTLYEQRYGWWWQSRNNPDKVEKDRDHLVFGSALHKLLLEGQTAYQQTYAVAPDPARFNRVLTKIDDYKAELASRDMIPKPAPKNAQEWLDLVRLHVPREAAVAWPNIMADFEIARGNKKAIPAPDHKNLLIMYNLIKNDDTLAGEELRKILSMDTTYPTIAELSFLWTDNRGVQKRSRFDKIVPNFTLDLKSLSNWRGAPLDIGISDHILRNAYDVQMADYQVARLLMHKAIQDLGESVIYGGTAEQRVWLEAIAKKDIPFEWVWLFYQVPDATSGRAPIVFPLWEHWRGPFHTSGHRKAFKAMETYLGGLARFGLNQPWGEIRGVHYTKDGLSSSVFLSSWGFDTDGAVADEDQLLTRVQA